jgi:hypothetical protein
MECPMIRFRCLPIPTETARRFRSDGTDDRGGALTHRLPGPDSRCPCRHCLRFAADGEPMLLGSYDLPRPVGVYWTPSPIFVHAESCAAYARMDHIPDIVRGSLVSVRAYDDADLCLYELGQVCEGTEVDAPLQRALADPRTAFVSLHTAKPGCMLCQVERLRDTP